MLLSSAALTLPQGKIFSLSFNADSPFLLVAGGDNGQPLIIDSAGFAPVAAKYGLPPPVAGSEKEGQDAAQS